MLKKIVFVLTYSVGGNILELDEDWGLPHLQYIRTEHQHQNLSQHSSTMLNSGHFEI